MLDGGGQRCRADESCLWCFRLFIVWSDEQSTSGPLYLMLCSHSVNGTIFNDMFLVSPII